MAIAHWKLDSADFHFDMRGMMSGLGEILDEDLGDSDDLEDLIRGGRPMF